MTAITRAVSPTLASCELTWLPRERIDIRKAIEQHKDVHLFLRNVSHIDETGHSALSRLAARGVKLSAAGLYSSYVVTQIQRAMNSRPSR